ncbi:MAG: YggS family pyridoxal phosphate-dependent enzyme [Firmicutes bacterium]|nr:YggS family pyridoxal phosphate-dependent enzyme [Bacillota bacterium]
MSFITDNVQRIKSELPAGVRLLAATKTQSWAAVREAIAAGVDACGENRVQEMTFKRKEDAYVGVSLHFIGHLQKNKLREVVGVCELIESVDSVELLRLIDARARALGIVQDVLLEINIAREASKTGFDPDMLHALPDILTGFQAVHARGLMAIPPVSKGFDGNSAYFSAMYQNYVDFMRKTGDNSDTGILSMGMSGDYLYAAHAGANLVRVGTGIFGPRTATL